MVAPTVTPMKTIRASKEFVGFPLDSYSYSAWSQFSSNPFMFKVNRLNGDVIETTSTAINVIGKTVHHALKYYYGGGDLPTPADDGEAIKFGYEQGEKYFASYSDGFIAYSKNIPNRAKLVEKVNAAYFGYLKDFDYQREVKEVLLVEKMLTHRVQVGDKQLPIPLKGSADFVYRDKKNRIIIRDHKFTGKFSDPEAIDGAKLIQAGFNYFLVYAELGEAPYSMVFGEHKITKNDDGSKQTREYEIVFAEQPYLFDFFYRLYDDITSALLGQQVYVPNIHAFYDKEVAILAYIHRLDVDEKRAAAFKKAKVDNITDFLKKRIQKDGVMKKQLEVLHEKFISSKTLNYSNMTTEEKIKMKYAEHGLSLNFDSKVVGNSVTLYRFDPMVGIKMTKIEAYVKDIEQVVGVSGVRILAPIPNSTLVGFEIPLKERTFPKSIPPVDGFNIAMGMDVMGGVRRFDIRQAPHLLVTGATGSGKSVFLNALIKQLATIKQAEMILLDPKMVELSEFSDYGDYHSDVGEINSVLEELVVTMNNRYAKMQERRAKNLNQYHEKGGRMPYIFVVIDEYGDLIAQKHMVETKEITGQYTNGRAKWKMVKKDVSADIKKNILILAQKARAAGIHIVLTTQRPSVNIVDGSIKANFPTRVAFRASSATDSGTVIDQAGAEKLLGKGDMLFLNTETGLERLQGFFA